VEVAVQGADGGMIPHGRSVERTDGQEHSRAPFRTPHGLCGGNAGALVAAQLTYDGLTHHRQIVVARHGLRVGQESNWGAGRVASSLFT
jgi:hypothetical protein